MIRTIAAAGVLVLLMLPLRAILSTPHQLSVLPSLQVDAAAYDAIGSATARSGSLDTIPPLQPPGFVLMLAAVYAVAGHSWLAAKIFLWLLLACCVLLAARLAGKLHGREAAGWTAALLTASAPALQAYVGTIQYEIVAAAWLLLLLTAAVWTTERRSWRSALGAAVLLGALAGAATLTREVFLVVAPMLAAYVAHQLWRRTGPQQALACALAVMTFAAVPVAIWALRQSHRTGHIVAVSDKGPLVMAFGNNPRANGTFNTPLTGVGEPSGFAFIRQHPTRTLRLAGRKFLYFWGVLRDGWNVPRRSAVWMARGTAGAVPLDVALPIARGGWLLASLIFALALWRGDTWRRWWVLPASVASILAVHLVTVSSHRFAVPVLPIVCAIIAGPLASLALGLLATQRRRVAVVALLVVLVVLQRIDWPIRYSIHASEMDGLNADNREDLERGTVRVADAARGPRAALLLGDEFLPRGDIDIRLWLRPATASSQPHVRVWLQTLDGTRACDARVAVPVSGWSDVLVPCRLERDSVATLAVETTGLTDLEFDRVTLTWR